MKYDLAISYAPQDGDFAERVAKYLTGHGLSILFDRWAFPPGLPWQETVYEALSEVACMIQIVSGPSLGLWQRRELDAMIENAVPERDAGVIAVTNSLPALRQPIHPLLPKSQPINLHDWNESSLKALLNAVHAKLAPKHRQRRPPCVFLCYAREDDDRVKKIYSLLRDHGLDAWYDQEKIIVGEHWRKKIIAAMKKSDFICLFLSAASMVKSGFVQKEMRVAIDGYQERSVDSGYLQPIKLDDCDVSDIMLDGSTSLSDIHCLEGVCDPEEIANALSQAIWQHWFRRMERKDDGDIS